MKVLDLQCKQHHTFEGWFGSEEDYQGQLARGLIECPMCGDAQITKMLSAPRINLGKSREPSRANEDVPAKPPVDNGPASTTHPASAATSAETNHESGTHRDLLPALMSGQPPSQEGPSNRPMSAEVAFAMQAAWAHIARQVMAHTEDVGGDFAEEARKIHYGETKERAIRGQATQEETQGLIEEGIDIMPLPIPQSLKRPLN